MLQRSQPIKGGDGATELITIQLPASASSAREKGMFPVVTHKLIDDIQKPLCF